MIISVDDGYVDDVTRILPALERFHMVATFFVITGRMTEPGFLDADQIRQLDAAGMDVGDHTAHHVDLRLLTASELRTETAGSRQVLEHLLGHPVYFFAYPFGAYNDTVVAAVKDAGFSMAYTTAGGDDRVDVGAADDAAGPRRSRGDAERPGVAARRGVAAMRESRALHDDRVPRRAGRRGPGGELAQAMRDEIAVMYDGLELDGDSMPKAGPGAS